MRSETSLCVLALCGCLLALAGCAAAPAPPPTSSAAVPSEAGEANAEVPLIEASAIAVRGDGKVAIIGGDENSDRLFAVALADFSKRWDLPFPPGTPALDDIEAVAPWGKNSVLVCSSQSRTKPRNKVKPERSRIALMALSDDCRRIVRVQVYENLRDSLIGHLVRELRSSLENPAAVSDETPTQGGFNVEGIAVWKGRLLVGLRSPTAKGGGAIVIPIEKPEALFEPGGAARSPQMGKPIVLPTKPEEGIRDMAADGDAVLLLLGPSGEWKDPAPRVVRWNPETDQLAPVHAKGLKHIEKPEGIAPDPDGRHLLIVQDEKPPFTKPVFYRLEIKDTDDAATGAADAK